ncbi:unnamed protein product [Diplocarpon coronariae]
MDKGTKGERDRGTEGQRDRGTKGPRDQGTKGPRHRRTEGEEEERDMSSPDGTTRRIRCPSTVAEQAPRTTSAGSAAVQMAEAMCKEGEDTGWNGRTEWSPPAAHSWPESRVRSGQSASGCDGVSLSLRPFVSNSSGGGREEKFTQGIATHGSVVWYRVITSAPEYDIPYFPKLADRNYGLQLSRGGGGRVYAEERNVRRLGGQVAQH